MSPGTQCRQWGPGRWPEGPALPCSAPCWASRSAPGRAERPWQGEKSPQPRRPAEHKETTWPAHLLSFHPDRPSGCTPQVPALTGSWYLSQDAVGRPASSSAKVAKHLPLPSPKATAWGPCGGAPALPAPYLCEGNPAGDTPSPYQLPSQLRPLALQLPLCREQVKAWRHPLACPRRPACPHAPLARTSPPSSPGSGQSSGQAPFHAGPRSQALPLTEKPPLATPRPWLGRVTSCHIIIRFCLVLIWASDRVCSTLWDHPNRAQGIMGCCGGTQSSSCKASALPAVSSLWSHAPNYSCDFLSPFLAFEAGS